MTQPAELTAAQLRRRCDPAQFTFTTTAEAPGQETIIGQDRATRAIEFGMAMPYPGYNVFATGPAGAGKSSILTRFLEAKAAARSVPPDWGYAHNFSEPDRPRALRLPPGGGVKLREQVNALLGQVADALDKMFASDQYAESRNALGRELDGQRNERFRELDAVVRQQGFVLVRTPTGMMVAPAKDDEPLTQEQFDALTEGEREALSQRGMELQGALERTLRQVQDLEEAAQARLSSLQQTIASAAIRPFFDKLAPEYADWPDVFAYLVGIQAHVAEHTDDFGAAAMPVEGEEVTDQSADSMPAWLRPQAASPFDRYRLNVIVDNSGLQGAPVIVETNPTYPNLIGRVEMRAEFGTLVTDYRQIKAGALHRANGGYLLLDARVLLRQPLGWEALKQALRNARIRIEDLAQQMGVLAAATLVPEPIPLDVKVVLIGDPETYYALYAYDEQFEKLFKVRADFAAEMAWTSDNEERIVRFIRGRCQEYGLPHFDASGVAKVIEYSGRLVEDQRKLTTRFAHVADVIQEAAFWAGRAQRSGPTIVTAADVQRAIDERVYRSNQYEERMRELITDGTILVEVSGAAVGQVNGLAVLELGDYAFGRPNRITCSSYQGRAGVINIEREARLSGRTHDKGILILTGFLGGRYAQDKPLSLSASIAFEQSYDGIDGDSASSTELYALLSSLADLPIQQGIAVTGSVNQRGEVQAIGGATAKIEGFYDVCRTMPGGLTGDQGVILPATNVSTLMLREDVVEAVAQGMFHLWPVRTIDEGIELLTGVPAGERGPDGVYPPDTVNGRVDHRLRELAEQLEAFGKKPREADAEDASDSDGKNQQDDEDPAGPTEPPPGEPDLPGDLPEPVVGR
jgi:lon-related putative ATP-dependent protease